MRALTSASGKAIHIDGRERPYTRDGKTYVTPADGPLCNSMGAARGNVRWYTRNAKVATCKSCLRALDAAHAEALKMNEVESAAARERARIAAQRAEFEQAAADQRAASMSVLLARGVTGYVEAGQRLRRADTGERGTVDAVGPNAVDMTMDDGMRWSGASWQWERDTAELESLAEAAVARPLTFEDFPCASRVVRKSDGVQGLVESRYSGGKLAVVMDDTGTVSTGHWSTFAPIAIGKDRELELLVAEVEANILDGALRRFAVDPVRFDATLSEAAALAQRVADTATRLAGPSPDAADVRALMGDVKRLTRWLGMSEPIKLLSYRSPYDVEPATAEPTSGHERQYPYPTSVTCPGFNNGGVGRKCIRCGGLREVHPRHRRSTGEASVATVLAEVQRCDRRARGTGPVFGGSVLQCDGSLRQDGSCPNAVNHV